MPPYKVEKRILKPSNHEDP